MLVLVIIAQHFVQKKRTKKATHLSFEKLQVILLPKLEQKKHEFAKKCNSPIFKMDLKLHLLHLKVFERVCSRKIKLSWKEF